LIDWRIKVPMPKLPEAPFPIFSEEDLVALFACSYLYRDC
jgi:hypothetical protein